MRLIAIDPGYDRCGVAIVEHNPSHRTGATVCYSTCIETNKQSSHEARLAGMYHGIEEIIAAWHPETLALETLFFSVNKKTAIKVAEARGVILLLAGICKLPVVELSPQEVKLSMTGIGNAQKSQVQKMVGLMLGTDLSKKIDDEVDAIALGIAALQKVRHTQLRER